MDYFSFESALCEQAQKCGDIDGLAEIVAKMADTMMCWQKQLNDYASTINE